MLLRPESTSCCFSGHKERYTRSFSCNFVFVVLEGTGGVCACLCACMQEGERERVWRESSKRRDPLYISRLGGGGRWLSGLQLHVEPVVPHAGAVPLTAAGPAPLQLALGLWTLHVHASSCGHTKDMGKHLENTASHTHTQSRTDFLRGCHKPSKGILKLGHSFIKRGARVRHATPI